MEKTVLILGGTGRIGQSVALDIILVIKYIFVSMVGVAKKKRKPNRKDTNPCFTSGIFYQHP